jgi:hypothetical protein
VDKRLLFGYAPVIAFALFAMTYGGSRPDDWPTWSILVLTLGGASLVILVILDAVADRNRGRWNKLWSGLKLLRIRSPLFIQPPASPPKRSGVDLAQFANAGAELQLRQHENVIRYGNVNLRRLTRLTESELMFLRKEMLDLRPILWEAADSIRVLYKTLLAHMAQTGRTDPRWWIAEQLRLSHLERMEQVLERFVEEVETGADSREALAGFHVHYRKSVEWVDRMAGFLGMTPDTIGGYENWRVRNNQYVQVLKSKLDLPQFEVVKAWAYALKPDDGFTVS